MAQGNSQQLSEISTWLDAALIQVAAESHLQNKDLSDPAAIRDQLLVGNTPPAFADPAGEQTGEQFIRLVRGLPAGQTGQVERFVGRYEFVDHHANDATGFSATLLRDKSSATPRYVLAFRSTEYKNPVPGAIGGDYDRDGFYGADGEIQQRGFAYGQLFAMERYWERLGQGIRDTGAADDALRAFLQGGGKVDVVGYSLGGHLANIFTSRYQSQVNQTILLNAAGRGVIFGGASQETEFEMLFGAFKAALEDPGAVVLNTPKLRALLDLQASARNETPWDPAYWFSPDPQNATPALAKRNIYQQSARYQFAREYVRNLRLI